MRVLFRADASSAIGSGHVFRCLGLADELRRRDIASTFACRDVPGNLIDLIGERGYPCTVIEGSAGPERDAEVCLTTLDAAVDWLVVDHYGLDAAFERAMGASARCIAVLDDLANRAHDCDLLVDSSHFPEDWSVYDGLTPARCVRLIGPAYVPLRREFFDLEAPERRYDVARNVLVTLGGNDPIDLTSRVLDAAGALPDLAFDVTVGLSNPRRHALERMADALPNVTLHLQHPRPSDLMIQADLCLGAGGQTSWERCFLGLPTLLVILADNQRPLATRLDAAGAVRLLGDGETLTSAAIAAAIAAAADDADWRARSGRRAGTLVDGRGLERITAEMQRIGDIKRRTRH